MTLILTHISRHGIVHASDSNLTGSDNAPAGTAKKTFQVNHLNAGLSTAGIYSVGCIAMDRWMDAFIRDQNSLGVASLSAFALNLKDALEREMTAREKDGGSMVQIAGYTELGDESHPEFWFVRNVLGQDPVTGEYDKPSPNFRVTEDFWTRDCPKYGLMEEFQRGVSRIYVNGFASGRIGFIHLQRTMDCFLRGIWNVPHWRFRPPMCIDEAKLLVELDVHIIGTLFELSDYPAPFIGGNPQTHVIPAPANTVTRSPAASPKD